MRRVFGKIISDLADRDEKIVLLVGDIGYGIFDKFREKHQRNFLILEFANKV